MDSGDQERGRSERRAERERRWAEWRAERARRFAERRAERERTRGEGSEQRKERVLHTRISEQLADDIRRVAEDLRVPVSNLVRNVLEETFSVVETLSDNVGEFIEDVLDETEEARRRFRERSRHPRGGHAQRWPAEPAAADEGEPQAEPPAPPERPRPEFPDVLGWQPLIANRVQDCADCGRPIARGERAFLGVSAQGGGSPVLCRACTEARR